MAALRDPVNCCAWNFEQTFETITPYTIEEAYEVVDAIAEGDMPHLEEELGAPLLQVIFYCTQMGSEAGHFDFDSVADGIAEKMIRRHPHVFGNDDVADAERVPGKIDGARAEVKPDPSDQGMDRLEHEVGDLLFVCVNLARKLGAVPESALCRCNLNFNAAVGTRPCDSSGLSSLPLRA